MDRSSWDGDESSSHFGEPRVLVQGGSSWLALTLSTEALDCLYVSHTGGKHDVTWQCVWSLNLGAVLARFDRRSTDPGALQPLRLEVQLDTVCLLVGFKQESKRGVAAQLDLGLAFLKLPKRSSQGVWGTFFNMSDSLRCCVYYQQGSVPRLATLL